MSTRILYVDDDDDIRELAQLALELDDGFDVRSCRSGEDALAIAPDWRPHLILLDVMMPRLDGPETLARLRQHPELVSTPVVFITARAQASERERLLAMSAAGMIAKPFDPMRLAHDVRGFLSS